MHAHPGFIHGVGSTPQFRALIGGAIPELHFGRSMTFTQPIRHHHGLGVAIDSPTWTGADTLFVALLMFQCTVVLRHLSERCCC